MQFVAFVEVGRVADEYTINKLFSNMKGDAGVGVRILTGDSVLRIDIASANEGIQFWANLNQAF
jgi:outer membrane translocation and assembly module TamA